MMPSILLTRSLLKAQGYHVSDNVIFQDDKSSILMNHNGRPSNSKRTKHIHIFYFYIMYLISRGETRVEWCPTKEMVYVKEIRALTMGSLSMEKARKIVTHDTVSDTDLRKKYARGRTKGVCRIKILIR